jgi:hypothetical protein
MHPSLPSKLYAHPIFAQLHNRDDPLLSLMQNKPYAWSAGFAELSIRSWPVGNGSGDKSRKISS